MNRIALNMKSWIMSHKIRRFIRFDISVQSINELAGEMSPSYAKMTIFIYMFLLKHFSRSFFLPCLRYREALSQLGGWQLIDDVFFFPRYCHSASEKDTISTILLFCFFSPSPRLEMSASVGKINYNCLPLASLITTQLTKEVNGVLADGWELALQTQWPGSALELDFF